MQQPANGMYGAHDHYNRCHPPVSGVNGEVVAPKKAKPTAQAEPFPHMRRPFGIFGTVGHDGNGLTVRGKPSVALVKAATVEYDVINRSRRGAVVARQAHNLEVVGSNPAAATDRFPAASRGQRSWLAA